MTRHLLKFRAALVRVLVAVTVSGYAHSRGAPPRAEPREQVLVLPPLAVEAESMQFVGWSKTVSPHFVLYSDHGAGEVDAILVRLERLRAALDRLSGLSSVPTRPITFIYPSRRSDWEKLEKLDRKEQWAARAVAWEADRNITIVEVIHEQERTALRMAGHDEHFGFHAALGGDFCSAHNVPDPLWLRMGVSLLAAYADVRADRVIFGRPNIREAAFTPSGAIPWDQFFAVTSDTPAYLQSDTINMFYAQFSLSVRYLLASRYPARRDGLYAWLYSAEQGDFPSATRFKEIFGLDWTAWTDVMEATRRGLADPADTSGIEVAIPRVEADPSLHRADLRAGEMRELFLLSGISGGATQQSASLLDHLLARGVKTASLRPLLASACLRENRPGPALALLRTLGVEGSANPRIYEEAARLLFERAVPRIGLESQLGTDTDDIRTLCRQAIALNWHSLAANDILAWSLALDPRIVRENLGGLRELIARQEAVHHTREIHGALALAAFRLGDFALAAQTCGDLLSGPIRDDRVTLLGRQISAALPPAAVQR